MKSLLTCCCGNRGHAPQLNRTVGVQLGSSRRAGPAPRAHPGPPNTQSPDPALGQNLGMVLTVFNSLCNVVITSYYKQVNVSQGLQCVPW